MTQQTFGEARDFVNFTFEGNASVSNILSTQMLLKKRKAQVVYIPIYP